MSTSVEGRTCASTWANCATGSQTAPTAGTREPTAEVTVQRLVYSSSNIQCVREKLLCSRWPVWNFEQSPFLLLLLSYHSFVSFNIWTVWSLSELPVAPQLFKYWVELVFFSCLKFQPCCFFIVSLPTPLFLKHALCVRVRTLIKMLSVNWGSRNLKVWTSLQSFAIYF